MRKGIIQTITFLLIASIILSCSVSRHAGVSTIEKPIMTETDRNVWVLYYHDQFDALEGNVQRPGPDYPESAYQAFQQVNEEWNKKERIAHGQTTLVYVVCGFVCGAGILYLFGYLFQSNDQAII